MARFRNDFGEDRVVPTLGYVLVPAGDTVTVPDDETEHWIAGGWTPLDAASLAAAGTAKPAATPAAAAPAAAPVAAATTESEATQ